MTSLSTIPQPSMLDLARSGNFRAIAYLINSYLAPHGIYARVAPVQRGCLHINVEFKTLPDRQDIYLQLRDRLIKFICQYIWRLNSELIEGVRIIGMWGHPARPGQSEVLWQKSVRIVTPANQQRQTGQLQHLRTSAKRVAELVNFKTFRAFLISGFAVASFIIGFGLSYADIRTKHRAKTIAPPAQPATLETSSPNRPKTVKAALETVQVIQHTQVAQPDDPTVTLMFSGDVTLGEAYEDLIGKDYNWAFDQIPEYRDADLAMVNLEDTLTTADTPLENKEFNFKADPQSVQVLTHGGVDIVNLGNNHAMDYNAPGLEETIKTLDNAGIHYIGAGSDITQARRPKIIDVKGQRIAYLGYYAADFHAAAPGVAGTNYGANERIAEDIQAIRDQVDWIIVNFHWGIELANYPEQWQSELAHFTIDKGADVVVGHHPHVLQGAEIYKGRPIAYSLGNFIFGGNVRSDYDTAVMKVSLRQKQMKVEFLPVEVRKYQPQVVKGERGELIRQQIDMFSSIFDQPMTSSMILDPRNSKVVKAPENSVFDTATSSSNPESEPFNASPFTSNLSAALSSEQPAQPQDETNLAEGSFASFKVFEGRQLEASLLAVAAGAAVAAVAVGVSGRNKQIKLPSFVKIADSR